MHNRRSTRLDTYLTQLLWALAKKHKGILRVSGQEMEDVPDQCAITTDYDRATHEIVIRAVSGVSEMIVINTEAQWTNRQTIPLNLERSSENSTTPRPPEERKRSAVLDDDHMEEIESRLLRRAAKRQQQREAEEMARVQRGES